MREGVDGADMVAHELRGRARRETGGGGEKEVQKGREDGGELGYYEVSGETATSRVSKPM